MTSYWDLGVPSHSSTPDITESVLLMGSLDPRVCGELDTLRDSAAQRQGGGAGEQVS